MQSITIIASILFLLLGITHADPKENENQKWFLGYQEMLSGNESPQIWWLRPKDARWSSFECIQISNKNFVSNLKSAEIDKNAGDFILREAPYDYNDEIGQGIIVIIVDGRMVGFRFRATMTNKKSLEIVKINHFDFKNKIICYSQHPRFYGITLKEDFRIILSEIKKNSDEKSEKIFVKKLQVCE